MRIIDQRFAAIDRRLSALEQMVKALNAVLTDYPGRSKEDFDREKAKLDALIAEAGLIPANGKDGR